MSRFVIVLLFVSSAALANQKAVKTTLGEASVNTPYSTCAAGDNTRGAKPKDSDYVDPCTAGKIHAGVCAACQGNPNDSSLVCTQAKERYRQLGLY